VRLRIRVSLAALTASCVAFSVAGCGSGPSSEPATDVVSVHGVAAVEPAADPRPLGAADTAFGLSLMRAWCAAYPRQNLVFSPSTLASALGMAYLGARGATARAMARTLDLPAAGTGPAALAARLQARSRVLDGLDRPGVTVAAVNQVWADPTLTTRSGYLNAVATGYDAGVDKAPFSTDPAKAAAEINQAISAATRGHIPRLVTPDMLSGVGWVLTSALYLNAKWAAPFDPNLTAAGRFTPAGARPVSVKFMNGDGYRYAAVGGWTAVSLPYQGGKLSMTALLPPPGSGTCALPTTTALRSISGELASSGASVMTDTAQVSLPKVSLSASGLMNDELKRLGMGLAFTSSADFSALSPQACCIAFVQQAATLQVGEKGTVGAAAAAVGIAWSAGQVVTHTVAFNRPYLMLVTDTATGEPLFLAKVASPVALTPVKLPRVSVGRGPRDRYAGRILIEWIFPWRASCRGGSAPRSRRGRRSPGAARRS
jgi:serpin B